MTDPSSSMRPVRPIRFVEGLSAAIVGCIAMTAYQFLDRGRSHGRIDVAPAVVHVAATRRGPIQVKVDVHNTGRDEVVLQGVSGG